MRRVPSDNKKANPIFDIDGCKKRSIHNIRSSRSSIFIPIENRESITKRAQPHTLWRGDPTIMYLLRALKYQLLSSSKMEESMQQYSHKYEVLHSGQKRKNVKKKKNTSQK